MRALGRLAAIAVVALPLASCSDADNARRFLDDQGYTLIEMLGSPWFAGCPQDGPYQDEFRAVAPTGRPVHGVVCTTGGFASASHVRFYDR